MNKKEHNMLLDRLVRSVNVAINAQRDAVYYAGKPKGQAAKERLKKHLTIVQ